MSSQTGVYLESPMRGESVLTNLIKKFLTHNFTGASWPASPGLATFLEARCTLGFVDFVDLYLFRGYISDLYLLVFIYQICSMQHFQTFCLHTMALFSTVFPFFLLKKLDLLSLLFSGETCERCMPNRRPSHSHTHNRAHLNLLPWSSEGKEKPQCFITEPEKGVLPRK